MDFTIRQLLSALFSAITLGFLFAGGTLLGQKPSPNATDQPPVIRSTTREVLLDLVVRDKHHHALTDLRPEEVEVYEDGVRQHVKAFVGVQGSEQLQTERNQTNESSATTKGNGTAPGAGSSSQVNALRQLNFVAVVFAQIAPLNLDFARQAVSEFLHSDNLPNTYVTVYRQNRTLSTMQPYTGDKDALAKAVVAATKGLSSKDAVDTNATVVSSANGVLKASAANIIASPQSGPATVQGIQSILLDPLPGIAKDPLFSANASSQDVSVTLGSALLAQSILETGLRVVNSRVEGMNAFDSLHELVRSQEKLPGRKVILYLADGLASPINQRDVVDNLISYANRSGVAFYTIDTRGLSVEDPLMQSKTAQQRAGAESSAAGPDPENGHREDDDIQLTAVANNQATLVELADATGGFSVRNTNEIAAPMQHVMEDIRTHYELSYTPTSTNYDGHFRKIEVRVSRPKTTIQTRKGYYALPELNGEPLQPFEATALNAINARPSPVEFPYQVAAVQFRNGPSAVEYEVAFELPVSQLKADATRKGAKPFVRVGLVALVRDANGEIINKISRSFSREVASADSAQRILYTEPLALPKGHFVIDAAATDEVAGKTTVKRISVFVDPGKDLALSSLQIFQKVDPLAGPKNPFDPFELGNARIIPTFADSLPSSSPPRLYFIVYPAKGASADAPNVTLEIIRDGKAMGRQPLPLPAPQPDGSIPVVLQLAQGTGQYDILVTAHQGTLVAQSVRSLKIE